VEAWMPIVIDRYRLLANLGVQEFESDIVAIEPYGYFDIYRYEIDRSWILILLQELRLFDRIVFWIFVLLIVMLMFSITLYKNVFYKMFYKTDKNSFRTSLGRLTQPFC
jgi:hypothetical protein